jgi:hypothetical protein
VGIDFDGVKTAAADGNAARTTRETETEGITK